MITGLPASHGQEQYAALCSSTHLTVFAKEQIVTTLLIMVRVPVIISHELQEG